MDRISINELTTYRWSFEEDVQHYAELGVGGIGVWRQKLSDFGEEKGAELIRASGLRVSSLLWAGGFTGSDGRTFKDSVEDGREAVATAAALQADCLVVYTGSRAGHTHNHARRLIRSAIDELTPLAEQSNVTLAVEPMHPGCAGEWTFLTDLEDTLALLEAVDSPHLKMVLDAYQLFQEDILGGDSAKMLARLPELAPVTALVQLGDSKAPPDGEQNRCRLGEGNIPLAEIVAFLEQAGYHGFYEVELVGEEVEAIEYQELLQHSSTTATGYLKV